MANRDSQFSFADSSWSVLIVYAHDSTAHEATVLALAEFLRDSFNIKVHVSSHHCHIFDGATFSKPHHHTTQS